MSGEGEKHEETRSALESVERPIIGSARFLTLFAVVGSLVASLLMFILGVIKVVDAYRHFLPVLERSSAQIAWDAAAMVSVIEALDRFLIAIVLLYFAYGVLSLFIRTGKASSPMFQSSLLPVKSIGQLKQVVAEVILVILFVLFLRLSLQVFGSSSLDFSWRQIASILVLPLSTALLALSLRLAELHPKTRRDKTLPGREDSTAP